MQIQRKLIKSARMLASRLFKVHRKPGSARQTTSHCVTEFHPTIDGTLLVVRSGDHTLSRLLTTTRYVRSFACPHSWMKECEAERGYVEVNLVPDHIDVNWQVDAIPQTLRLQHVDCQPLATTPPLSPVNARLIPALAATSAAVDRESLRFALSCIQLDATRGTVTGTDGRRLIRYDGFEFPWRDQAILLPANDVFGSPILREATEVSCGVIDQQLVIQAGPWTLRLPLQTEGRYPDVTSVIGRLSNATNRVYFDQRDLAFIVKHLKRFPGDDQDHCPVSLDLNGHVDLAACGDERTRAMRLRLSRTFQVGKATATSMNRHFLSHAAQCGITDLLSFGDQQPVICRGPNLSYVWQPLAGVKLPPESPETIQIDTTNYEVSAAS